MSRYYIGITIISIFVLFAIIYSFSQIGSPFTVRNEKIDEQKVLNFKKISSEIDSYYQKRKILPTNLSDLSKESGSGKIITGSTLSRDVKDPEAYLKDPDTKGYYEYRTVAGNRYQLCTTFRTSALEEKKGISYTTERNFSHPNGHYCFDLNAKSTPIKVPSPRLFPSITKPPSITPTPVVYYTPCAQYSSLQACNNAANKGETCAWYICQNVCLTTGTSLTDVCSSQSVRAVKP